MGIIIDTNIFIAVERGRVKLADLLAQHQTDNMLGISAITASELLHGVRRATSDAVKANRSLFVEKILKDFPVYSFDLDTARIHAGVWADLHRRGQMIGNNDLIIAATALKLDYAVATLNAGEFQRVRNLVVHDWSSEKQAPA